MEVNHMIAAPLLQRNHNFIDRSVSKWLDIHFGSLLPGIIIHFVNNFILLTIISQEVTVITNPTLLVNATPVTPWLGLLNDVVCYLPVSIFALVVFIKRKKAAPAEKQ